jgi:hypothetical protein
MAHEFYNHVVEHSPRLPDPEGFRKDEEIRDFYSVTNQRVPGYEDRLAAYQERMDILGVAAGKIMFVNGKAFERDEVHGCVRSPSCSCLINASLLSRERIGSESFRAS